LCAPQLFFGTFQLPLLVFFSFYTFGYLKRKSRVNMTTELVTAYSATAISLSGIFIFMYLLYTKKSTNPYSLIFSIINMISSSLWITYGRMKLDTPLLVRGSSDLLLFTISAIYIMYNRLDLNKIQQE
jgi:hypothetical protein